MVREHWPPRRWGGWLPLHCLPQAKPVHAGSMSINGIVRKSQLRIPPGITFLRLLRLDRTRFRLSRRSRMDLSPELYVRSQRQYSELDLAKEAPRKEMRQKCMICSKRTRLIGQLARRIVVSLGGDHRRLNGVWGIVWHATPGALVV